MKKDKKQPQEKKSRLADKKIPVDDLNAVAGGQGEGINGVQYTDTIDIPETIQEKI